MTTARTERAIGADVHNLLGHRCREACAEAPSGCAIDDDTKAMFTVVFRVDDSASSCPVGVFGFSMCTDCVADTRAAMADDIERITTLRRGRA